jgi:DNA-binding MarR family transcriptional regulator
MALPTLIDFLGSRLRQASNQASQDLARRLAPKGVTVAEWEVLWTLYGDPQSPSIVASGLSIDRGAITRLADRLVKKGLLVRRPSKTDRRGQTLALTRKGSALALELLALVDHSNVELKKRLGAKQYADTARLVEHLLSKGQ